MGVSKNNPNARDNQRLVVSCPSCNEEMELIKKVPGGMVYLCPKGKEYPVFTGSYKDLPHKWVRK
ncbi:MAG: hypothetical protein ACQES9_06640 [Myxococcota bacterium]